MTRRPLDMKPTRALLAASMGLAWTTSCATTLESADVAPTPQRPRISRNTRTVLPAWWERLLIAPNRVNYHLEHHLLMTVPHYHLPRLHQLLRERGALDHACVERGYWNVLRRAASRTEGESRADAEDAALTQLNGLR